MATGKGTKHLPTHQPSRTSRHPCYAPCCASCTTWAASKRQRTPPPAISYRCAMRQQAACKNNEVHRTTSNFLHRRRRAETEVAPTPGEHAGTGGAPRQGCTSLPRGAPDLSPMPPAILRPRVSLHLGLRDQRDTPGPPPGLCAPHSPPVRRRAWRTSCKFGH